MSKKKPSYQFYNFLRHIIYLIPVRRWRRYLASKVPPKYNLYNYSAEDLTLFKNTLAKYPDILSNEETIKRILENNMSFVRIGDGEFDMITDGRNDFNRCDAALQQRLRDICENGSTDKCLICLNQYNPKEPWFLYHGVHFLPRVMKMVKFGKTEYGDAYFLRNLLNVPNKFYENLELIKSLWDNKKLLIVCNQNSFSVTDSLGVFDCVAEKEFLFIPSRNAFDEYDEILGKIKCYPTDWKILLEVGPTAKPLAIDLNKLGYQAMDVGAFYKRMIDAKAKIK